MIFESSEELNIKLFSIIVFKYVYAESIRICLNIYFIRLQYVWKPRGMPEELFVSNIT